MLNAEGVAQRGAKNHSGVFQIRILNQAESPSKSNDKPNSTKIKESKEKF